MSAGTVVGDICAVADVEWLWAEAGIEEERQKKNSGSRKQELSGHGRCAAEGNPTHRKNSDGWGTRQGRTEDLPDRKSGNPFAGRSARATRVWEGTRQATVSGEEEVSGEVGVGGQECPPHKCPAHIGGRDCPNWQECFGRQEGRPFLLSNGSSLRDFSGQWLTGKQRGELAEAAFVVKAASLGFGVAKPWGDSDRYDFIVDVEKRLWRVQVKSAHRMGEDGSYSFRLHTHSLQAYTAAEIDVLVAYVVPEDDWYVFPVSELGRLRSLKLFPGSRRKRSRFERWREAWWVFGRK